MNALQAIVATTAALWLGAAVAAPAATVYKSPTCGCCGHYADYLRANGFRVAVQERQDMDAVKRQFGVDGGFGSCHTTVVDGYVVEGHVPVGAIDKLLRERPKLAGIALPGMPAGSPGMGEVRPGTLKVVTLPRAGETSRTYAIE